MEAEAIIKRMIEATGARSQTELASIMGYKASAISDAKRRGVIPEGWYAKLFEIKGLNPRYLKTGEGPKRIIPNNSEGEPSTPPSRIRPFESPTRPAKNGKEEHGGINNKSEQFTQEDFWGSFQGIMTDPDLKGWFKIEFQKRFPELMGRIERKGKEAGLPPEDFWGAFHGVMAHDAWRGWFQIEFFTRFPELIDAIKKRRDLDREHALAQSQAVA